MVKKKGQAMNGTGELSPSKPPTPANILGEGMTRECRLVVLEKQIERAPSAQLETILRKERERILRSGDKH